MRINKRNKLREDLSHINVNSNTKLIPLTKGGYAIVDEEDYDTLMKYTWHLSYYKYAVTAHPEKIPMHRLIMGLNDKKLQVDHINHNGLDNRKCNLRICTNQQNTHNTRPRKGTSKYKGVGWWDRDKKWRAKIFQNGKTIHIGYYEKEEEAAKAYDRRAIELFGEFAYLNFPELLQTN